MGCFSKIAITTGLTGGLLVGLNFLGFSPPLPVSFLMAAPFILTAVMALSYGQTLDAHKSWLRKINTHSHRDTEVLIPPQDLKTISHAIEEGGKKNQKSIKTFLKSYNKSLRRRLAALGLLALAEIFLASGIIVDLSLNKSYLTGIFNVLVEDFHFAVSRPLPVAVFAGIIVLFTALAADGLKNALLENKKYILGQESRAKKIWKLKYTLVVLLLLGLLASAGMAVNIFQSKQQAKQETVQTLEDKAQTLEEAHSELLEKNNFLAKENARLGKNLKETSTKAKELGAEKEALQNKVQAAEKEVSTLEKAKKSDAEEIKNLKGRIATLENSLNAENTQTEQELSTIKQTLAQTKETLLDKTERLDLTTGRLEAIQEQLNKTSETLSQWQEPLDLSGYNWPKKAALVNDAKTLRISSAHLFASTQPQILLEDSADILAEVAAELDTILAANPNAWVVIKTHSNALPPQTGAYSRNAVLTGVQAEEIKQALAENGLDKTRVLATGLGHQHELDSRLTKEALAANNRTELQVIRLPF